MKLSNDHAFFSPLCAGCIAAVRQTDIDPDEYLRIKWLCGRCLTEIKEFTTKRTVR